MLGSLERIVGRRVRVSAAVAARASRRALRGLLWLCGVDEGGGWDEEGDCDEEGPALDMLALGGMLDPEGLLKYDDIKRCPDIFGSSFLRGWVAALNLSNWIRDLFLSWSTLY